MPAYQTLIGGISRYTNQNGAISHQPSFSYYTIASFSSTEPKQSVKESSLTARILSVPQRSSSDRESHFRIAEQGYTAVLEFDEVAIAIGNAYICTRSIVGIHRFCLKNPTRERVGTFCYKSFPEAIGTCQCHFGVVVITVQESGGFTVTLFHEDADDTLNERISRM